MACLSDLAKWRHTKRACALRSSARYGRLLKETKRGLAIDQQAVAELARFDGKFVVHSNDDTLTAEYMALGYKQQQLCGRSLADDEEWVEDAPGVSLGAASHSCPCRHHGPLAVARANRRIRLPG